jgi:protein-S-isoprenylcysteine O-methyltransferase Ste14
VAVAGGVLFVTSLVFGVWCYAWTFGTANPSWTAGRDATSGAVDVLLFTAFALHHSVFAREPVRQWVANHVSPHLERSLYVWVASSLLIAVLLLWRPVGGHVWVCPPPWSLVLTGIQLGGVVLTLRASAALDVLSLAGVRQTIDPAAAGSAPLLRTGLYRLVRHPIYFGWALMVWPTPTMTGTRLVFAAVSTLYLVAAIPFEERSLRRQFGDAYGAYASEVRWRMVPGLY